MQKHIKFTWFSIILLLFALSLPNVYAKYKTESGNSKIELAVDFKHIYLSTKKADDHFQEDVLQTLKDNGITSIGFTENSLYELENRELVHVLKGTNLQRQLWNEKVNFDIIENYTYVVIPGGEKQDELIQTIEDSELGKMNIYRANDTVLLEIDKSFANVYKEPLLYLKSDVELLTENFLLVPRISNKWKERLPLIKEQLIEINNTSPLSSVVFLGGEVEGFDEKNEKVLVDQYWNEIGIGMIEIFNEKDAQNGSNTYAYSSDFNTVRVHSIPKEKIEKQTPLELKRLVVKAANERNIRMFYLNIPFYDDTKEQSVFFELLNEKISSIYYGLDESGYTFGSAEAFAQTETKLNKLSLISSALGAFFLFVYALSQTFYERLHPRQRFLFVPLVLSGTVAVISSIFGGYASIVTQLASLGITLLLPIWASFILLSEMDKQQEKPNKKALPVLLSIAGLYIVGLSFLAGMNYDLAHITYAQGFKGVSLTLTVPILVVTLYLAYKRKGDFSVAELLKHKIRIIDVLIIAIVLAFFAFYISRSGNAGSLLPFEAQIRNWLEDVLNVRPRTKEIFFAFPIMTLMVLMWNRHKNVSLLLPIATLGLASICNTFTHFHTPLLISLTRTLFSLGIGALIGLGIAIIIQKLIELKKTTS